MMTTDEDAILEVARILYEKAGPHAVYELAELLGIKPDARCLPCDGLVPVIHNTCMVCWSVIYPETNRWH